MVGWGAFWHLAAKHAKNCLKFKFAGGGIVMAGGVDSVVKLAEQLQAPVCSTYLHNDSFPKSHPLWMGKFIILFFETLKVVFVGPH